MRIKINLLSAFLFAFSSLSILIVYWLEYFEDILPCELCYHQRWPYFFFCISSAIVLFIKKIEMRFFILVLISILLLISTLLSLYHSGIELNLWQGVTSCSNYTRINSDNLDNMKKLIMDIPIVKCNVILWKFHIFSLANLNLIFSSAFLIMCLNLNYEIYTKIRKT